MNQKKKNPGRNIYSYPYFQNMWFQGQDVPSLPPKRENWELA
jgi:hypothetical protein